MSVAILHGGRGRGELVRALLAMFPSAELVLDDGYGELRIGNRRGCWPIARRAWASTPANATHRLVLEDDAEPCDGFAELAAAAAAQAPDAAISFFHGARECSVATLLPTRAISSFLACADLEARVRPHHDQLLELGLAAAGVRRLRTEPSLVEHADVPSLLGHPPVRALAFERRPSSFALVSWR